MWIHKPRNCLSQNFKMWEVVDFHKSDYIISSRAGTNTLDCYLDNLRSKQRNIRLFFDYIISTSSTVSMLHVLRSCSTNCLCTISLVWFLQLRSVN